MGCKQVVSLCVRQAIKSLFVAFILIGVVPLLLGLLFELVVVVPLRVPLDQTPVFFPWQDWALGVLHTKIICAVTMMGPQWWLKRVMEQVNAVVWSTRLYCYIVHGSVLLHSLQVSAGAQFMGQCCYSIHRCCYIIHGSVLLHHPWANAVTLFMGQCCYIIHGSVLLHHSWLSVVTVFMGQCCYIVHGSVLLHCSWVSAVI